MIGKEAMESIRAYADGAYNHVTGVLPSRQTHATGPADAPRSRSLEVWRLQSDVRLHKKPESSVAKL